MIAGTALTQVMPRSRDEGREAGAVEAVVEHQGPPETSEPRTATTSALTWNSGSGLKPRSAAVSRCAAATARATCSRRCSSSSDRLARAGRAGAEQQHPALSAFAGGR